MWEKVFMDVTYLSAVILALVGVAKMPFKAFKQKHPKWYRATFFLLSLVLVVGGSIIAQLFIIEGSLASVNFALLILGTGFIVFGGYTGYESANLKGGIKKLVNKFKAWLSLHANSKIAKFVKKYGLDRINAIGSTIEIKTVNTEISAEETQEAQPETNVEVAQVEPIIANEEKKEGE